MVIQGWGDLGYGESESVNPHSPSPQAQNTRAILALLTPGLFLLFISSPAALVCD